MDALGPIAEPGDGGYHKFFAVDALLAAELVVLVWAGEYAYSNVRLHFYAQQFQDMALTVLGAGLIGSALLEDVLIHNP